MVTHPACSDVMPAGKDEEGAGAAAGGAAPTGAGDSSVHGASSGGVPASRNVQRDPPPLVLLEDVPERQAAVVRGAVNEVTGYEPRDYQVVAVNHTAFEDDTYLVINRRTADGKSLIPFTTKLLRPGVGVVLVPLIGLGSDQVEKATYINHMLRGTT